MRIVSCFLLLSMLAWSCGDSSRSNTQSDIASQSPFQSIHPEEASEELSGAERLRSPSETQNSLPDSLSFDLPSEDLLSIFQALPEEWKWPYATSVDTGPYYAADSSRVRIANIEWGSEHDAADLFWLSDARDSAKYLGLLTRKNYLSWETTFRVLKLENEQLIDITSETFPEVPYEKLVAEFRKEITSAFSVLHQKDFHEDYSLRWSDWSRTLFHQGNHGDIPVYAYHWRGDHFEASRISHEWKKPRDTVRVSGYIQLMREARPNRVLLLSPGIWRYAEDYSHLSTDYAQTGEYYFPPELIFRDLDNFTLIGEGEFPTEIQQTSPAGVVLSFVNCRNLELINLKGGHDPDVAQVCNNGVFEFFNCENVLLKDTEMYGCGTVGITSNHVKGLYVEDSRIFECSSEWVDLSGTEEAVFRRCSFEDAVQWHYFRVWESGGVRFEDCTMRAGADQQADYIFEFLKNEEPVIVRNCTFSQFDVKYFANLSKDLILKDASESEIQLGSGRFSEKGVYD